MSDRPPCLDALLASPPTSLADREETVVLAACYTRRKHGSRGRIANAALQELNAAPGFQFDATETLLDLINRAKRMKLRYDCGSRLLRQHCDVATCATREHGVSSERGEVTIRLENPVKVKSKPSPHYLFEIKGKTLKLSPADLLNQNRFAVCLLSATDEVWMNLSTARFNEVVAGWLDGLEYREPAPGECLHEVVAAALVDFLERHVDRSRNASEYDKLVTKSNAVERPDGEIRFTARSFRKHLTRYRHVDPGTTRAQIADSLKELGCDAKVAKPEKPGNRMSVRVWCLDPEYFRKWCDRAGVNTTQ